MKKLLFSAVALVAFSSVSMANTIAVDEGNQKLTETIKVLLYQDQIVDLNKDTDCFFYAIHQMDMFEANYGEISDVVSYNNLYQKYIGICQAVGPTYGG